MKIESASTTIWVQQFGFKGCRKQIKQQFSNLVGRLIIQGAAVQICPTRLNKSANE